MHIQPSLQNRIKFHNINIRTTPPTEESKFSQCILHTLNQTAIYFRSPASHFYECNDPMQSVYYLHTYTYI